MSDCFRDVNIRDNPRSRPKKPLFCEGSWNSRLIRQIRGGEMNVIHILVIPKKDSIFELKILDKEKAKKCESREKKRYFLLGSRPLHPIE
jgi:hypothetical protein